MYMYVRAYIQNPFELEERGTIRLNRASLISIDLLQVLRELLWL